MIKDLVLKNRTYRKFDSNFEIKTELLLELVDLARISNSARNSQALKFVVVSKELNDKVFDTLVWAGALKDWDGPSLKERPSGYIVICNDTDLNYYNAIDVGIMTQSIMLGAVEKGLGGCQFGAIKKEMLREVLGLDVNLEIKSVLAIGKPTEIVQLTEAKGSISYYRKDGVHYVPKRSLDEITIIK
jgi:nitroreductase